MKNIFDILREKERQLQSIQREIEALKLSARLLAEEGETVPISNNGSITQPEMIRNVLSEKGEPMHVNEISEAIKKKYKKRLKTLYLTTVIYRQLKAGKNFNRAIGKPNTFGLLEWELNK
jgi:regulator of replication initiation timing